MMFTVLQLLPFLVVSALSAVAIFGQFFDDNLLQRIGLSGICAGSVLTAFVLTKAHPDTGGTLVLLGYGLAIYGIGTLVKVRRHSKS